MLDDVYVYYVVMMMMMMVCYMNLGDVGGGHWFHDDHIAIFFIVMYIYGLFFMNSMGCQTIL